MSTPHTPLTPIRLPFFIEKLLARTLCLLHISLYAARREIAGAITMDRNNIQAIASQEIRLNGFFHPGLPSSDDKDLFESDESEVIGREKWTGTDIATPQSALDSGSSIALPLLMALYITLSFSNHSLVLGLSII